MPVKVPGDYAAEPQYFLDDPFFQAALRVATPAFYMTLARQQFRAGGLSDKEAYTLLKYINRYCFRPTPFGLFSSITLVPWAAKTPTEIPSVFKVHIRTAMPLQTRLSDHLLENQLVNETKLAPNPSIYRVLNEYRFFRTGLDDTGKRDYQLQSIAYSKVLKDLVTNGSKGYLRQEVISQIVLSAECTLAEAEDYADFLVDAQLLVSCLRLPITGPDHLERLSTLLDESELKAALTKTMAAQRKAPSKIDPAFIETQENNLSTLLPDLPGDKLSIILQRETNEALASSYQEKLRDGIAALELLTPGGQLPVLSEFIQGFQQHFEGRTLPLLQALDPEAGIGYQQPEKEKNNPLLETLNIPYRSQAALTGIWSAAHAVLLECWLRDKSNDPMIRLQDEDLERLKPAASQQLLGMSVLFRIAEDKVFIENAGGINAPALMGRFTLADEQIAAAAQDMARHLEALNPDIIFAELLHLADPHTDNVNRRLPVYQYELPITAASTLPQTQQLQLSDLYIRVVNNQVILFSEKHQKIVIPRLTSAYNHSLNKLPIFRFLADLAYQYGRSSLAMDLRQLFPDLRFYPRVEYRDAILSLATWILTEDQINALLQADDSRQTQLFTDLSAAIRLPRYFSLAEGDQELVFDGQSPRDIHFFANCIRQKKEAVLKEFLDQPIIKQYNAYLLPSEPLVLPEFVKPSRATKPAQRKFMPGSEWLYLKVYAPRIGVNRLLLRLAPLLNKRYSGHKIDQWFFIRYEDHAPHIRLRLKIEPAAISKLLLAFKTKLEDHIQQQVIREFQVDIYTRELERYAAGGIENTERLFWASSELVLHFLKANQTSPLTSSHAFALYSTHKIIEQFINQPEQQIKFTLESFQQFLPEFTDKPIKVALDRKYRELTPDIIAAFRQHDPAILSGSLKAGTNFTASLQVVTTHMANKLDEDYLRSIVHMHLNRIFTDESRKQEMICYYLLHKYLLSMKGRNKRSGQTG
ncbi:MAG: lantibiotic dehydratase [Bacteroidota bacterium]